MMNPLAATTHPASNTKAARATNFQIPVDSPPPACVAVVSTSSGVPSRGTVQVAVPLPTAPVALVSVPGAEKANCTPTASAGLRPAAAIWSAYGTPPTCCRRSVSVNAVSPPSMRSDPDSRTVASSPSTALLIDTACSGPAAPLIDPSSAVASSTVANGCTRRTVRLPSAPAVGPSTTQPAATASSKRRSSARPGACTTTPGSATATTVIEPLPSGSTVTLTATSTRHAARAIAATNRSTTRRTRHILAVGGTAARSWNRMLDGGV